MDKKIFVYTTTTPEETTTQTQLFMLTFPEVLESVKPVVDHTGKLWAGKDRKTEMQDPFYMIALWKAWCQSFRHFEYGGKYQKAMDYYQSVKHLSKPPKEEVPVAETPKFSWSPSKLSQFETCPYQFAAAHYYKTLPYTESEAAIWGTAVHKAAEDFMNDLPVENEEAFKVVEPFVKLLKNVEGKKLTEYKMALDENWKEAEWSGATARMIVDLAIENGDEVKLFDYKTGKMKTDQSQMKIYALVWALLNPHIQKISCKYIWLKDKQTTGFEMTRAELLPVFKEIKGKIDEMKAAWDNENFPMKKNGLCRNWCGVTDCPHNGGGR